MGSFADRAKSNADRQINDKGDDVVLVHRYDCVYSPSLGEDVCTEDLYPIKGVISNYSMQEIDGEAVMVDDLQLLVRVDTDIENNWEVQYNSKVWQIIDVSRVRTQNETIIQKLQIRALT